MDQLFNYVHLKNQEHLDAWLDSMFDKMIVLESYQVITNELQEMDIEKKGYYHAVMMWIFIVLAIDVPYWYTACEYEKILRERKTHYQSETNKVMKSLQILKERVNLFSDYTNNLLT